MNVTKTEREMMKPGTCTACGADSPYGRNSAGQCSPCHNAAYHAARAARKVQLGEHRAKGRAYWESRGIRVGQKMIFHAVGIFGGSIYHGTAKVGCSGSGAYVYCPDFPGYLVPEQWEAAR